MKTIRNPILVSVLSAAALLTFAGVYFFTKNPSTNSDTRTIEIEGREYRVLAATNTAQWSRGLMHVRRLDHADGMAFYFGEARTQTFWNMNTFMDLEVVWMRDGKVIGRSDLPSIEKSQEVVYITSPGPADTVVELVKQ